VIRRKRVGPQSVDCEAQRKCANVVWKILFKSGATFPIQAAAAVATNDTKVVHHAAK
jgi:hypothetical protein